MDPCGPLGCKGDWLEAVSELWQSVQERTVPTRMGGIRLTTSGLRRDPSTGWNEGFPG